MHIYQVGKDQNPSLLPRESLLAIFHNHLYKLNSFSDIINKSVKEWKLARKSQRIRITVLFWILRNHWTIHFFSIYRALAIMSTQKCIIYATISRKLVNAWISERLGMLFFVKRLLEPPIRSRQETLPKSHRAFFPSFLLRPSTTSTTMSENCWFVFMFRKYDFSVLNNKGITYVAMTDRDMPLRIVFVWIGWMEVNNRISSLICVTTL